MTTEAAEPQHLEIDPSQVGELDLGEFEVPYVDLNDSPYAHTHIRIGDVEYLYDRSYPVKGHSAEMPADVSAVLAKGKRVLVAARSERYYLYLA